MTQSKKNHKDKPIRRKEEKPEEPELPKYRDRAKERREDQNPDYEQTELGFHAVAPPGTVDIRSSDAHKLSIEKSKYLGGYLDPQFSTWDPRYLAACTHTCDQNESIHRALTILHESVYKLQLQMRAPQDPAHQIMTPEMYTSHVAWPGARPFYLEGGGSHSAAAGYLDPQFSTWDPRYLAAFTHIWDQNESNHRALTILHESMYKLQLQMGAPQDPAHQIMTSEMYTSHVAWPGVRPFYLEGGGSHSAAAGGQEDESDEDVLATNFEDGSGSEERDTEDEYDVMPSDD